MKYFSESTEGWRVHRIDEQNLLSTKIINKS
jgi:hypothetical protein